MKKIETLIIGAGISGLAYANFSKEDHLIVEKEDEIGGLCRTFYVDGFVWDYAGHFFHFADERVKDFFKSKIKEEDLVSCEKVTKIYYKGRLIDYPFQMNIHQLPKSEFIDCLYDLFHKKERDTYLGFEDMLYGRFGRAITEKFLKPYNEKLYACALDSLDADAMGRFFPYADIFQIIDNMKKERAETYNSHFEYPRYGAKVFVNALAQELDPDKIRLNCKVGSIDVKAKTAVIDGGSIQYERLISTIPFNELIKLLHTDQICRASEDLHSNKVLVFNIGFDRPALDDAIHWIYFPDADVDFYRVGFYNNILGDTRLSIYVETAYPTDGVIDIEMQYEKTLEDLKKCGLIRDHKVIAHNDIVIDPAYVHITTRSKIEIEKYIAYLNRYAIYPVGRYGRWTYCSIEDCILQVLGIIDHINGGIDF